jgi:phospholipid-binding lipoprotein MlaA
VRPRIAFARGSRQAVLFATAIAALTLGAAPHAYAAHPPPGHGINDAGVEDPLEGLNRFFYKINRVIDHVLLRPLALGYQHITPKPIQKAVHNVVTELGEPLVFVNDVLQIKPKRAVGTAVRFGINATFGLAGTFDPAAGIGLPHHDNGFAITLGRYGIKPGPYVFLPLLGPTDFRDLIGLGVDTYADPIRLVQYPYANTVTIGVAVFDGLDQRVRAESDLNQIEEMGTDPYATLRSLYLQDKEAQIRGDKPLNIQELPDFDAGSDANPMTTAPKTPDAAPPPEASSPPATPAEPPHIDPPPPAQAPAAATP